MFLENTSFKKKKTTYFHQSSKIRMLWKKPVLILYFKINFALLLMIWELHFSDSCFIDLWNVRSHFLLAGENVTGQLLFTFTVSFCYAQFVINTRENKNYCTRNFNCRVFTWRLLSSAIVRYRMDLLRTFLAEINGYVRDNSTDYYICM
jgi:hypothetical protein